MKKKLGVSKPTTAQIQQFIPTNSQLKTWTDNLWNAKQFFNDDESKSYGVFRSMDSQLDVWAFAKIFQATKNKDLFGFLESYLDAEEISMIYNIIQQKPLV
jgi:F0F1-type ATP synthase delta subunit